jgi:hypothetical protein
MWDQISDLHAWHREVPVEIQLLKLTEEVGEAAEAFIGMYGLNSRKGVCRSRDDLLAELRHPAKQARTGRQGEDDLPNFSKIAEGPTRGTRTRPNQRASDLAGDRLRSGSTGIARRCVSGFGGRAWCRSR